MENKLSLDITRTKAFFTEEQYESVKKEVRSGSLASVLYRMLWIKCLADGLELWKCIWK